MIQQRHLGGSAALAAGCRVVIGRTLIGADP
jgi:hypothetical protein